MEKASGGVLLIDEVTEIPLETQSKILRVVIDQKFKRINSNHDIKVDVRIICASSKNINNEDFSRLASMSKIKSDLELDKITWISHQLHGAIGFTWDYGLHLYTKKILINKSLGGDLNFHSTKLYPDGN